MSSAQPPHRVNDWLLSLWTEWSKHVTGGPVTAALFFLNVVIGLATFWFHDRILTWYLLWASLLWITISVFLAAFRLHGGAHAEVAGLRAKLGDARSELQAERDAKTPKLLPTFERLVVASDEIKDWRYNKNVKGSLVVAMIAVANDGAESVVRRWEIHLSVNGVPLLAVTMRLGTWQQLEVSTKIDHSKNPPEASMTTYASNLDIHTLTAKKSHARRCQAWTD